MLVEQRRQLHRAAILSPRDNRRGGARDRDQTGDRRRHRRVAREPEGGLDSYAEFAPVGWVPPEPDRELTLTILRRPSTRALLATIEGEPAGHVSFNPARGNPFEDPDGWRDAPVAPGQAHLWQLFVLPQHWGAGVAGALHDLALAAMRDQGYDRARLFTPAAHARARRFYERRGWRPGGALADPDLGLELVEYRIELSPPAPPGPRRP
jgi:GNAT superfamily N-acetyltransferase